MAEKDALQGDSNFPLIRDGVASYLHDKDPEETREWMQSLDGLLDSSDPERARTSCSACWSAPPLSACSCPR